MQDSACQTIAVQYTDQSIGYTYIFDIASKQAFTIHNNGAAFLTVVYFLFMELDCYTIAAVLNF
jgi:hypothetical protein